MERIQELASIDTVLFLALSLTLIVSRRRGWSWKEIGARVPLAGLAGLAIWGLAAVGFFQLLNSLPSHGGGESSMAGMGTAVFGAPLLGFIGFAVVVTAVFVRMSRLDHPRGQRGSLD